MEEVSYTLETKIRKVNGIEKEVVEKTKITLRACEEYFKNSNIPSLTQN